MGWLYQLRAQLGHAGMLPLSRLALVTWYLLALDIFLFLLQKGLAVFHLSFGQSLGGWVSGLSFAVIVLFIYMAMRWAKAKLLWRLRNRLIVTYIFIGVIPVILLVALALGFFYLFGGQFATFIVTTRMRTELESLKAANSAITQSLAGKLRGLSSVGDKSLQAVITPDRTRAGWNVYAWFDGKPLVSSNEVPILPSYLSGSFCGVVRDHDRLFFRVAESTAVAGHKLTVVSSAPLDQRALQNFASHLGEITLYASGFPGIETTGKQARPLNSSACVDTSPSATTNSGAESALKPADHIAPPVPAGVAPPPARAFDGAVTFWSAVFVDDWATGANAIPAALSVQTRFSMLYERLFESMGDFVSNVETLLLTVAVVLAIIELAALIIGVRLTRSMTGAVAQLYQATEHINRGDFSHRIPVHSSDQLATLAKSFNSMTESLEKLMIEQKEKQRMENELVIAQEVQAQLFPRHVSQLSTLEVFGFCRPARTVSGDYYDFLAMDAHKLMLAVGDVSGKGIAAALLMATIHSAVRAYSLEGIPILREPVAAGGDLASSIMLGATLQGVEVSPGALLALLNHQLYDSTPAEKYATLFLGIYDSQQRSLTYSNGGHLPPIILGGDRSLRKLDQGGTVVGLFDDQRYDEAFVPLRPGDLFVAYSDGVTEPENDFGEFGEERLIELVWENRELSLPRISELVTAAVDDWIGDAEQPDDVTLVLARSR
jgi:sigma-B regulation protein RsbU (phosphoserine phosphatase)